MQEKAPYQKGSDTSKAAGESIEEHLSRIESSVLYAITYSRGMNCWEVEQKTGISRACSSARLNELCKKGLIFDSGIRRITDTGRNAVVYMRSVAEVQQQELF